MKKILTIALAALMMFAFTQCGGNGDKQENENKNETEITNEKETSKEKAVEEAPTAKGTKQFTDMKKGFDECDKIINNATTCEEIEQVAMAVAISNVAIGLGGGDQYSAEEKMTEKEQEKLKDISESLLKKAQKKAEQLGCEKKEYSL